MVIPFKVEVDRVNTQLASFRKELRSDKGFTWESWNQAALFCAQNKTNLDEALLWANNATSVDFGGDHSFQSWSTKAAVLDSLGRNAEATEAMKKGLPYGNMNELYFYGRTLTRHKKGKEALEIFKMNYDKNPNEFLTNAGMARGYSAVGDYKKALDFAQKAQSMAPDQPNKAITAGFIKKLQDLSKDINWVNLNFCCIDRRPFFEVRATGQFLLKDSFGEKGHTGR